MNSQLLPEGLCNSCFKESNGAVPCPYCKYDPNEPAKDWNKLPPGFELGKRYVVGRPLGQDGFGVTYLAYDTSLKLCNAIKEYFPPAFSSRNSNTFNVTFVSQDMKPGFESGRKEFLEEARDLVQFKKHPNIVSILDIFEANGTAYIVMPHYEGMDFLRYLKAHGNEISFPEAMRILLPIMKALDDVHAKGFVHGDVSPENIFITNGGEVKLLDFGAAKSVMPILNADSRLRVIGREGYYSSELMANKDMGPWTDVYSMAATLYRALTGEAPPTIGERVNDKYALLPPSAKGAKVSKDVDAAILRGLSMKWKNRWKSMTIFREALKYEPELESEAEAESESESEQKKRGKPPSLFAIEVSIIIGILALIVFALAYYPRIEPQEPITQVVQQESHTSIETGTNASADAQIVPVTGVTLNKSLIVLQSGASEGLTATVEPSNAANKYVLWTVSEPEIAVVDQFGTVTANSDGITGDTTVMVTAEGNNTASCVVTVQPMRVTGVSLNKTSTTLLPGAREMLTAIITPSNAANKYVLWTVSEPEIAVVDQFGTVTANSEGIAGDTTVMVTAEGNNTASCVVTVQSEIVAAEGRSSDKRYLKDIFKENDFGPFLQIPIKITGGGEMLAHKKTTDGSTNVLYKTVAGASTREMLTRDNKVEKSVAQNVRFNIFAYQYSPDGKTYQRLHDGYYDANDELIYEDTGIISRTVQSNHISSRGYAVIPASQPLLPPPPPIHTSAVQVGGVIQFGRYNWQVLDVMDNKALIITQNIIEQHTYNVEWTNVTWETCSLRRYLNGEFLQRFSREEQERIAETSINNPNNPWFRTSGGNLTNDKIFLLSIEEVVKYFGDSMQLQDRPRNALRIDDQYNSARIANYNGKASWWWLRSLGGLSRTAVYIDADGIADINGHRVDNIVRGIRPVMWINL